MYYYLSNITNNPESIRERRAQTSVPGSMRTLFIAKSLGERVTIVSMGAGEQRGIFPRREEDVSPMIRIIYLPEVHLMLFGKKLRHIFYSFLLFGFLVRRVKKNDRLILYNEGRSFFVIVPVLVARLFIGFQYILETEELYSYKRGSTALGFSESTAIKNAAAYIAVSEPQMEFFPGGKPVLLGAGYSSRLEVAPPAAPPESVPPIIVYSGRLDDRGGADFLLEALRFISKPCKVVITGFGSSEAAIRDFENHNSNIEFLFAGFLEKGEYFALLERSKIGMNPIRNSIAFSDVSFPSKIMQYLEYGNIVVSSDIPAIHHLGSLRRYILTYTVDSAQAMAGVVDKALDLNIPRAEIAAETRRHFELESARYHDFFKNLV